MKLKILLNYRKNDFFELSLSIMTFGKVVKYEIQSKVNDQDINLWFLCPNRFSCFGSNYLYIGFLQSLFCFCIVSSGKSVKDLLYICLSYYIRRGENARDMKRFRRNAFLLLSQPLVNFTNIIQGAFPYISLI